MNGGKERKVNLNASHLCLAENTGLPAAGQYKVLYGNGAVMVPNVHAVMAWAARKILAIKADISSEELQKSAKMGEGRQFYYQGMQCRG